MDIAPAVRARDAIDDRRWSDAVEAFAQAENTGERLSGPDLLSWGMARYWLRDLDGAIGSLEAAAARCRDDGDDETEAWALQAAIQIASWDDRGAVVTTCTTRLRQLLDSMPEGEFHALWEWATARVVAKSDFDEAARLFEGSLATALRVESRDVEALALTSLSQVDAVHGRVDDAVRKIDAAAALALSGELRDLVAGGVLCGIIWSCRNVADWDRAAEWTDVATRWSERAGVSMFPGLCAFHRCEVLRVKGDLEHAETHALRACEEMASLVSTESLGVGYRELGLIRLLRGEHKGARTAFQLSAEHGVDPNPGLALLRLREGEVAGARRALEDAFDAPMAEFEIPFLLPVLVTACLAGGDLEEAQRALEQLEDIASRVDSGSHRAAVAQARAEIAHAGGDLEEGRRNARLAAQRWRSVGAPYESARARETLGRIGLDAGARSEAVFDLETARAGYAGVGANFDVARLDAELQRLDTSGGEDGRGGDEGSASDKAFMFTDIVDSTRLQGALGDDRWRTLLDWHDRALREAFVEHGGSEIKHEGDGLFVAFDAGESALRAACGIQRRLAGHRREAGFAPDVRIGVHEGSALARGDDWIGFAVTLAARVAASAGAGEVVCTDAVLERAPGAQVSDTRTIEAKGVDGPVQVHRIEACR